MRSQINKNLNKGKGAINVKQKEFAERIAAARSKRDFLQSQPIKPNRKGGILRSEAERQHRRDQAGNMRVHVLQAKKKQHADDGYEALRSRIAGEEALEGAGLLHHAGEYALTFKGRAAAAGAGTLAAGGGAYAGGRSLYRKRKRKRTLGKNSTLEQDSSRYLEKVVHSGITDNLKGRIMGSLQREAKDYTDKVERNMSYLRDHKKYIRGEKTYSGAVRAGQAYGRKVKHMNKEMGRNQRDAKRYIGSRTARLADLGEKGLLSHVGEYARTFKGKAAAIGAAGLVGTGALTYGAHRGIKALRNKRRN